MARRLGLAIVIIAALMGLFAPVNGADIHVDNANGVDSNDGLAAVAMTVINGPVRTLKRATQLVQAGDTIVLNGNGRTFYEPLCLVGGSHSGFLSKPFTIQGNGAVISGLRALPSDGWRQQSAGVWQLSLTRKGYYRFFRGDQSIPEFLPTTADAAVDDLPLDHYWSSQGAVLFKFDDRNTPFTQSWTYAADDTGVSLVSVRNVRIVNLHIVGFRVDGINVDGNCRGVTLDNVTVEHCGRAGVSANGTSQLFIENSHITANGRHSVFVSEFARVNVEGSDLGGVEPTVVE